MDSPNSPSIPHPSLSRYLQSNVPPPVLIHSLHESRSSVLSLASNERYIFSGSQNQDISVWDKETFQLKDTLRGHTGSVLGLEYAKDKKWLFSSSGDSTVRVWSTETLEPLYIIQPYMGEGAGDLFSLAWSSALQTIFIGCQNTSLQWFDFREPISRSSSSSSLRRESEGTPALGAGATSGTSTPNKLATARQAHKFFDSYPQYERKAADIHAKNGKPGRGSPDSDRSDASGPGEYLCIPATNVIDSAHYGYIYTMTILTGWDQGIHLATGSGDELVKLWACDSGVPELVHEFECSHGAVLALVSEGDTIYAGCQDGYVRVFDLETKTFVRTIIVQEGVDIIAMSMLGSDLYTCSADGWIKRWSASFDCTASWKAHDGIALSSIISRRNTYESSGFYLISGGSDDHIKVWGVTPPKPRRSVASYEDNDVENPNKSCIGSGTFFDTMVYALSKFTTIPSISSIPAHREDCRQAAIWLRKCLGQLGAKTSLLPTGEGNNPIVLATFSGAKGEKPKRRVLFYGQVELLLHYDVIPAPPEGWHSDPFILTGRNGYLYGRGATDNKGPIIAVACAAADLLSRRALEVDLVFLIEGDEECGSKGFKQTNAIGNIDAILVSNSTWIADAQPCITYGLRGVVHCSVEISADRPDLHSGIEGGAVAEPMVDMYLFSDDKVRPQTTEEKDLYKLLSAVTNRPASLLSSRWREPSFTIHNVEISGPKNATIIPSKVNAQLSLRLVPDQSLEDIVKSLREHLQSSFNNLRSPNKLTVNVKHTADWWLGDLEGHWFESLESAVQEEWGVAPLRIREGGSIPSVPYLEKEFGCHALHLPMGQSSDQAHLPDERISLINLRKGKAVIERFLLKVAASCKDAQ
ncbi:putative di- and tripeptidase DUG2 [Psilocybe cubensis]|uniref:Di- and tripeptidase DUG2 n=1 Tax=Psilocybe cubensis TaxID=181762 RepID=A0ACB8GX37_PSICU|nr:putative di- and tripeptidase DUG2 [Psilocybe cubensis]KAH9480318.1 putative di- and tripeptidase DUG2 [Psilocybe cubensis]